MGVTKKFSEELYRQYDRPAVEAVLQYLEDNGVYAKVSDDRYTADITVFSGYRHASYIEVEVVSRWEGSPEFPWPLVHLPQRKGKYLELGKPITFYRLSADLRYAILIPDHLVTEDRLAEVPNRLVESGELFYRIDRDLLEVVDLQVEVDNAEGN